MEATYLDESAKTVLVLRNPKSGARDQGKLVDQLESSLKQKGYEVLAFTDVEELKSKVGELAGNYQPPIEEGAGVTPMSAGERGLRAVVAAGGDGTVSLLANLLPASTPLAILPLGTENLLAKYLCLKPDPAKIADVITAGRTVKLDAGRANNRLFLVMLSCGFDADVVHRLHSNRKGHIQHWSYAKPILGAMKDYDYPVLKVWGNGEESPTQGKWAFVFNVPRYAMNLPFVLDADPQDGNLDILTFHSGKLFRGLFYLATVLMRQHRNWGCARHQRLSRFRIESDRDGVRYQLDGDPGGLLPVDVEVVPARLNLLVPPNWDSGKIK